MAIYRVQHNKNYTVINNTICKDNRISWKAKGIWLYAFSRPDDWKFHINDLIKQSTDGESSVTSGLKELETFGYLVRDQERDDDGQFGVANWTFYETPQAELKKCLPKGDFPPTVNPPPDNPPILSTEDNQIRKQQQEHVAVFSCLRDLGIEHYEKVWLCKNYDEQTIEHAIEYASKAPIRTTLIQTIKWACEKKPEIPSNKEEIAKQNKINQEIEKEKLVQENKEFLESEIKKSDTNLNLSVSGYAVIAKINSSCYAFNLLDKNFQNELKSYISNLRKANE